MIYVEITSSATQMVQLTEKDHYPLMKLIDVQKITPFVNNVPLNVTNVTTLELVPNVLDSELDFQNAHAQIIIILMMKEFVRIVIINVRHAPISILVTHVEQKLTEF